MPERIITGFHAIEEKVLSVKNNADAAKLRIMYGKLGPRVKKILTAAERLGIQCEKAAANELDNAVRALPEALRDHRGILLFSLEDDGGGKNLIDFDAWILSAAAKPREERQTVVILDSITDPHNVGAIIRSCDQFGASLVVLPERRSVKDVSENEVIARVSAGSSAWVPFSAVSNLVRTVERLKEHGFWIYGADSGGASVDKTDFAPRSAVIMGSEGSGISRLLEEQCDTVVSIPTCGKVDSLNVSVAAGVLLYEIYRRQRNF
ncbi:MAG: 23S rRNA (guanosine(2251)-2'-O)-methyltransferase RlmB [Treponema sp.]